MWFVSSPYASTVVNVYPCRVLGVCGTDSDGQIHESEFISAFSVCMRIGHTLSDLSHRRRPYGAEPLPAGQAKRRTEGNARS
jgi:hypothetical protein